MSPPSGNNNKENQHNNNKKTIFPYKLWRIVNDPKFDSAIQWTEGGLSFVIHEENFINLCLGKKNSLFFTTKPRSFVRQLHLYGFKKIDQNEFMHKCFRRDKFCLLKQIKRSYRAVATTTNAKLVANTSADPAAIDDSSCSIGEQIRQQQQQQDDEREVSLDEQQDQDQERQRQRQGELLEQQLDLQAGCNSSSSGASFANDSQASKCESLSCHNEALELDAMIQTVEPILVEHIQDDELYIFEGSCLVDISFNTWS